MYNADIAIEQIKFIGPAYAKRLGKLNIFTLKDLLYHIPSRYDDLTAKSMVSDIKAGEKSTITGKITEFENIFTKYGKRIQKALFADSSGTMEIIWYNQPFLENVLKKDLPVSLSGQTKFFGRKIVMESPQYEIIRNQRLIHTGRLVPIYPETEGVSSKWLRSRLDFLLNRIGVKLPSDYDDFFLKKYDLMPIKEAIYSVHFPDNNQVINKARQRLAFDELLPISLSAKMRKKGNEQIKAGKQIIVDRHKDKITEFISDLPFKLTEAQIGAYRDIMGDLRGGKPMNRLVEGDVGCGKTVVAAIAMYLSYLDGFQSVLMAPTEILANQHFETINTLLAKYGINIALMTSAEKAHEGLKYDIYIGTHAILYNKLDLSKLALIVIDEQQRFGVAQRAKLASLAVNPHILSLTATPIPRTIALTLFSDLELTVIDELPIGRQKVKTYLVPSFKRDAAYAWIRKTVSISQKRKQCFIVCPLIDASESLESVKSVKIEFDRLKKNIFPDFKLSLLHGRLKDQEKKSVIGDFRKGKCDILVTTPVVEVGVDIPNAIIMMIEDADRFGLSQLHQLRGRVGRGKHQSYCLLFTQTDNDRTVKRLKLLETNFSGPKLAEMDLNLRGPGEILGTRQHGLPNFKVASYSDTEILEKTNKAASEILDSPEYLSGFHHLIKNIQADKIENISNN